MDGVKMNPMTSLPQAAPKPTGRLRGGQGASGAVGATEATGATGVGAGAAAQLPDSGGVSQRVLELRQSILGAQDTAAAERDNTIYTNLGARASTGNAKLATRYATSSQPIGPGIDILA
jgi:hypothetical protein